MLNVLENVNWCNIDVLGMQVQYGVHADDAKAQSLF